jgi:hypothetical protein
MPESKVIVLVVALILSAATASTGNPASKTAPQPWELEVRAVTKQLEFHDAAEVTSAVALMKDRIKPLPAGFPSAVGAARSEFMKAFAGRWGNTLVQLKRYDDVEQIAVTYILISPDTASIAAMQKLRIAAFHAAGKDDAALGEAKSYYNACSLKQTGDAVALLTTALVHARPDQPDIGRRFRAQQMATGEQGAATMPDLGVPILASVKVDGSPFEKAIADNDAWEFKDMMAKANLLLLADRAKEAGKVMHMAHEVAGTEKEIAEATEGVARAMRGADGNVARANAWLVSLRK